MVRPQGREENNAVTISTKCYHVDEIGEYDIGRSRGTHEQRKTYKTILTRKSETKEAFRKSTFRTR
jgi:hypothetical protein